MPRTARALVTALAAGLLLAGCTHAVSGRPWAAGASRVAAKPVVAADVAQTSVTALQGFWRARFPAAFGRPWRDITRFLPVHVRDRGVPCVSSAADVAGQAFYCPSADAVAWDADGLNPPVMRADGPTGVLVVLAHEVGHAVQSRLGIDALQERQPSRYPTILLEAMADCDAGVALAHFALSPRPGLALGVDERDQAMSALIAFKDPLGVQRGDSGAHGNAFDRVSAFQDGYDGSATTCASMTTTNRPFTQRAFGSRADAARRGNLPVDQLLDAVGADAPAAFARIAAAVGLSGWRAPALRTTADRCAVAAQGPAAWCPDANAVVVDRAAVARWGAWSRFARGPLADGARRPRGGAPLGTVAQGPGSATRGRPAHRRAHPCGTARCARSHARQGRQRQPSPGPPSPARAAPRRPRRGRRARG